MNRLVLILALFLAACSTAAPPASPPIYMATSQAWKLTPGTYAEYDVSEQPGMFNDATGEITLTGPTPAPGYRIRITALADPSGGIFRALGPAGENLTAPGPLGGWLERSTGAYIGEAGNRFSGELTPPEPLLTINPTSGEVLTITTQIAGGGALMEAYRTISVGDVVKTTLVERPGEAGVQRAYTMTFDGELKRHIFGTVNLDNTVDATIWDRTYP